MFRRQKHFGAAAPVEPAFNNSHNNKNYILVVKPNFSINNNVQPFIGGNQTLQKRFIYLSKKLLKNQLLNYGVQTGRPGRN